MDWKILFTGTYDGYKLIIKYDKSYILKMLYSKDEKNILLSISHVSIANGEIESFAESLPKENMLFLKHSSKETNKFFILNKSSIIINKNYEIENEIKNIVNDLEKNKKIVYEIADTYNIKMKELEKDNEVKKDFFIEPMNVFKTLKMPKKELKEIKDIDININKYALLIGKYKSNNELFHIDKKELSLCIVIGKDESLIKTLSVISEELSLHGLPILIFDLDGNSFSFANANKNTKEIKDFSQDLEATAFPVRVLDYKKNEIWADLELIDEDSFIEAYSLKGNAERIIRKAKANSKDLDELYDKIDSISPDNEIKEYDLYLAKRIIKTIKQIHPKLYKGSFNSDSISKTVAGKIGKISIVNVNASRIEKYFVVLSTIKSIKDSNTAIIIKDGDYLMPKIANKIEKSIINAILNKDSIRIIASPSIADINDMLYKNKSSEIQIINNKEVAFKGNKIYRIILRPLLSQ